MQRTKRYMVGTRDTEGLYRCVGVDARTISEAKEVAVRKSEDLGFYVIAVSAKVR